MALSPWRIRAALGVLLAVAALEPGDVGLRGPALWAALAGAAGWQWWWARRLRSTEDRPAMTGATGSCP
jgi:hypothetical protein